MSLKEKFENFVKWINKRAGKEEKLTMTDKLLIDFFFTFVPKVIVFMITMSISLWGYNKYGIERTMIVIAWILIFNLSMNFQEMFKMNKVKIHNQLEFFKNYEKRKSKVAEKP